MKKMNLVTTMLLFVFCLAATASSSDNNEPTKVQPTELQTKLTGTYVPLFSDQGILAKKWDALWLSEATKAVGADKAAAAVEMMKHNMAGTMIGKEATDRFGDFPNSNMDFSKPYQFCCDFTNGVAKLVFNGRNIKGLDVSGKVVFDHNYSLVGYDKSQDAHKYKSDDGNVDEFTYFVMRSDSPADTHHIEFRYGSDPEALVNLRTGRYAYWMAAGVREGNDADCEGSIKLFVKENLSAE